MAEGSNPTDRGKLGTKRHILTGKNGIPMSVVISSASTHDIKLATGVMDNMIIKRSFPSTKCKSSRKRKPQHLCLDKSVQFQDSTTGYNQARLCSPHTSQEKQGPENRGGMPKEVSCR